MATIIDNSTEKMLTRTLIAGVDSGEYDIDDSMKELENLCEAGDLQVVCQVVQKKDNPENKYYLGEGKMAEVKELCHNNQVELCVFDCELTGSQIKNISDFLEIEVIDRTMLILEIFSKRATTAEGKLQTELALLKYQLPRLSGMGASLSRQGGGGAGGGGARRGAGESKLEYDRRHINQRITLIKEKLEQVEKRRDLLSEKRKKNDVPVVALTGYTNVGKSSLLNALLGEERAIVTPIPGTTRDMVQGDLILGGSVIHLTDTAGLHATDDPVEQLGVARARRAMEDADLVLAVFDQSRPLDADDRALLAELQGRNVLIVLNKADLAPVLSAADVTARFDAPVLTVSAADEATLAPLKAFLAEQAAVSDNLALTQPRHVEAARRAARHLRQAAETARALSVDMASIDLQSAQLALAEITGDEVEERLLDRVFGMFCVGK